MGLATKAMCVFFVYVVDSHLRQVEAMTAEIPNNLSASVMVYFTCQQGHVSNGLMSPPKDNLQWFIGAQSDAELNDSQDHYGL